MNVIDAKSYPIVDAHPRLLRQVSLKYVQWFKKYCQQTNMQTKTDEIIIVPLPSAAGDNDTSVMVHTSLMRFMKRVPKRHGLWRLHCRELTVICCDCCTATATTCTASYISAASVCKQIGSIVRHIHFSLRPVDLSSPVEKHGKPFEDFFLLQLNQDYCYLYKCLATMSAR